MKGKFICNTTYAKTNYELNDAKGSWYVFIFHDHILKHWRAWPRWEPSPLALATFYTYPPLNRTICTVYYLLYQHYVIFPYVSLLIYGGHSSLFNLHAEGRGSDRTGSGSGLDLGHSDGFTQSLGLTDRGGVRLAVNLWTRDSWRYQVFRHIAERCSVCECNIVIHPCFLLCL